MSSPREKIEKAAFVLGLAVLAFLYGFATHTFGWFPSSFLERAWLQAQTAAALQTPDFVVRRAYDRAGARTLMPGKMQPGLTMISTIWEDEEGWKPGVKLIDARGRSVHEWHVDPDEVLPDSADIRGLGLEQLDFQGTYLFPNGDLVANLEYAGTVRLDACGEVVWQLPAGSHHSIARADDGSFWIPGVTRRLRVGSPAHPQGFPGLQRPIYQDLLLRVSPEGEVLETLNVLDILYANGMQRYIAKGLFGRGPDITHLNDIEPLSASMADTYPLFEAGDLVVSLVWADLVFVVDPDSGRIKWHASQPFIRQHDPDFMGDGWIGVFDNNKDYTRRGTMLGGSRIIAFRPHTSSARVIFPTRESDPFYTGVRGKWQQLENGNLMLTESEVGRVVEVDPEGRTVWEWVNDPYDDEHVPYVSKGERIDLTEEDVAAWPCATGGGGADREASP